ncbi:PREDICTED: uncharacterized protein LOC108367778 [Rhagoletis zephyria]|uniref:uncharacterized protein LOC108367778 n=1 Tax=Rhagoletis zephyria TaxID=28612 RepID=UPI0008118940|nr:PREDICTED: uncharacterized protein LOC108367778 [Rhagoletis zephyria]
MLIRLQTRKMANSHQNTDSKYTSFTGQTNGCAQQNSALMANVCERSPGEELLVWKSNLHTFHANSSRNKQASSQRIQIDLSHATAPHNSAIDTPVAGVPKSCDDSISIDPR